MTIYVYGTLPRQRQAILAALAASGFECKIRFLGSEPMTGARGQRAVVWASRCGHALTYRLRAVCPNLVVVHGGLDAITRAIQEMAYDLAA